MQARYPARFEREMGCTESELLRWLPGAVGAHPLQIGLGQTDVAIGDGRLTLTWQVLPPRQIAQVRLPRLAVTFEFTGIETPTREAFMRYFDLYMQRGGG